MVGGIFLHHPAFPRRNSLQVRQHLSEVLHAVEGALLEKLDHTRFLLDAEEGVIPVTQQRRHCRQEPRAHAFDACLDIGEGCHGNLRVRERERVNSKLGRVRKKRLVVPVESLSLVRQVANVVQKHGGLRQKLVEVDGAGGGVSRHVQHVVRLIDHNRGVTELNGHGVADGGIDDVVVGTEYDLCLLHHFTRHELPVNKHTNTHVRAHALRQTHTLQLLDVEHAVHPLGNALDLLLVVVLASFSLTPTQFNHA